VNTRVAFFCAALMAAALAACGGGGGGTPPTTKPSSTPTGGPISQTITLGSQTQQVLIPANIASSGTLTVPAGSGTVLLTGLTTVPSPVPTVFAVHRAAAVPNKAIAYLSLTAQNASATLDGLPGVKLTLPSGSPSGTYYIAYYATGGQTPAWTSSSEQGSGGGSGQAISIASTVAPAITLSSGESLYLALYEGNYIPPINVFGCVPAPTALPAAASRSVRPALVGVHPIDTGSSYTYNGSLSQSIYRSEPCPQPTATANATVTVQVTMSPDPGGNAMDEDSTETDAYTTSTTQVSTVAVVSTPNPGLFYEAQETSTDEVGDKIVTTYAAPGLLYANTGSSAGTSWSNNSPATVNQTDADGSTFDRTYSSGGAYTETDSVPNGVTDTITVRANGSGSYVFGSGTSAISLAYSAPSSSGAITLTIGLSGQSANYSVPPWTLNGAPVFTSSSKLYSDSTTNDGSAALPSSCTFVAPSGSGSPEQYVRTIAAIDPVIGYVENETIVSYDIPNYGGGGKTVGPVCVSINDRQSEFYDYSLTTASQPIFFTLDGNPVLTNTISESLSLNAGTVVANLVQRTQATLTMQAAATAHLAAIRFTRALERADRIETMATSVTRRTRGGL
jgi:hypothetical protein